MKRILRWTGATILLALILSVFAGFIAYWRSTNDCDRKTALVHPMKAIRFCEYGSPDVLKFEDVEKPAPNDDQVLIRVHAASLNLGKVTPVIDRTYKLSETAEAMRYFEEGHARGKVVIAVE